MLIRGKALQSCTYQRDVCINCYTLGFEWEEINEQNPKWHTCLSVNVAITILGIESTVTFKTDNFAQQANENRLLTKYTTLAVDNSIPPFHTT